MGTFHSTSGLQLLWKFEISGHTGLLFCLLVIAWGKNPDRIWFTCMVCFSLHLAVSGFGLVLSAWPLGIWVFNSCSVHCRGIQSIVTFCSLGVILLSWGAGGGFLSSVLLRFSSSLYLMCSNHIPFWLHCWALHLGRCLDSVVTEYVEPFLILISMECEG